MTVSANIRAKTLLRARITTGYYGCLGGWLRGRLFSGLGLAKAGGQEYAVGNGGTACKNAPATSAAMIDWRSSS